MPEKDYRRLTQTRVRRKGFFAFAATRTSLWLGKDHLLSIDSSGYTEEYKRFYFRDIQAITLCGNQRRVVWNWILSVLLIPCLTWIATALFSVGPLNAGLMITALIVTSFFAIPLIANNLFGPTCNCYLRTAVQIEELASISRFGRARKALAQLRPLIAEAQGELPVEEIPTRLRALAQGPEISAPAPMPPQEMVVDESNLPPRLAD